MEFLEGIAAATVKAAHVPPGAFKMGGGVNTTGITLITPGGNYAAFWVRDFAMSLDCGLIGPDEMLPLLKLIARTQNGPRERKLPGGAVIPPYAVADFILMNGHPEIVPIGQYQSSYPFGPLPPADNHFFFTHIAWAYWRDTNDADFLSEPAGGLTILDRLIKAFHAVAVDPVSGAVTSEPKARRVGFGFQDSIGLMGQMCFATLLRWRAAKELAELCEHGGRREEAEKFETIADTIAERLVPVFAGPAEIGGWLRAATQRCRQPDVWATLFALHLGVLPDEAAERARDTVARAVESEGVIEHQGAVRHVPTTHDFSKDSAWEATLINARKKDRYQNGAYWHTPTGWLIQALEPVAPELARGVFERYIGHLRQYDFRLLDKPGAPWECFGIDLAHAMNPVYMTSVTLPLGVLRKMG